MTVDVIAQLAIGQQFADAAATGPLMIGILAAAAAGLISFASPCVVPLVPGYMSYLASVVGGEVDYDAEGGRGGHQTPVGGSGCGRVVHSRLHRRLCAGHRHRGCLPSKGHGVGVNLLRSKRANRMAGHFTV